MTCLEIMKIFLGASPLTAITWNVMINIIVEGIFQPICAATVAFIICPIGAFVIAIGAFIRKAFRDAWDSVLFQVKIIGNFLMITFGSKIHFLINQTI